MSRVSTIRCFTTSAISRNSNSNSKQSLYSFKSQLDDYIYFHSLSSQWRPYVYRQRNADKLVSLNSVDKKKHPITPKKYPGIPSLKKLVKFIDLLVKSDEVKDLRNSLDDLFKIRITKKINKNYSNSGKYLQPDVISQFLYKSYQIDPKLFSENLLWIDQINEKDSIWCTKNTEAVAFVRSMIIKSSYLNNSKLDFNWFNEKLNHWICKSNMNEQGSILYNASSIIASVYSNSLTSNLKALENLDNLTKDRVFTVKPNTDYQQYDHAFSIISALKDASLTEIGKENLKLVELVERWSTFLSDVEKLKGDSVSNYERFLESEKSQPLVEIEETVESNTA